MKFVPYKEICNFAQLCLFTCQNLDITGVGLTVKDVKSEVVYDGGSFMIFQEKT